jgi:hypothetical protein
MTGYINVMLILQSCTDPLHIPPGSSGDTYGTLSDCAYRVGNMKVEEDLDMGGEEEELNVKTEEGIGSEEEECIDIENEEDIYSEKEDIGTKEEEDIDIKEEVSLEDKIHCFIK